jgi:hypothetical protein
VQFFKGQQRECAATRRPNEPLRHNQNADIAEAQYFSRLYELAALMDEHSVNPATGSA